MRYPFLFGFLLLFGCKATIPTFGEQNESQISLASAIYYLEQQIFPTQDTTEVINSQQLYQNIMEDNDHQADQVLFARSKLFEMILADWTEPSLQNQWIAVVNQENTGKIYQPVLQNRDHIFYNPNTSIFKKLQKFSASYDSLSKSILTQDRRLTHKLSKSQWIKEAQVLQQKLNDETLNIALRKFPKPLKAATTVRLRNHFKSKRQKLIQLAENYYHLLSKKVDVVGSNQSEYFEITRFNDQLTTVVVYQRNAAKENTSEIYRRNFFTTETEEIRLYGLAGNDEFNIKGNVNKGIHLITVGGLGQDLFNDSSVVKSGNKSDFYDTKFDNPILKQPNVALHLNQNTVHNQYNPENFASNNIQPFLFTGYTDEEGLYLGGGKTYLQHRYGYAPYKRARTWRLNFAPKTQGFNFNYQAHYPQFTKNWGLKTSIDWHMPQGFYNYYLPGNETTQDVAQSRYWDVNLQRLKLGLDLERFSFQNKLQFTIGTFAEGIFPLAQIGHQQGETPQGILENPYKIRYFAGLKAGLNLIKIDDFLNPKHGFKWMNQASLNILPFEQFKHYTQLSTTWAMYISPATARQFTLAFRSSFSHNLGNFPFYAAQNLGGLNSLRAYSARRFAGRTAWLNNLELRNELFKLNTSLARFTFGGLTFVDGGRVWADAEQSHKFHLNYGLGGWVLIPKTAILSGGIGFSKEYIGYLHAKVGFLF